MACLLKDLGLNGSVDSIRGNSGKIHPNRRLYNSSLYCSQIRFLPGAIPENLAKPRRLGCSDLDTLLSEADKALEDWSESKPFFEQI